MQSSKRKNIPGWWLPGDSEPEPGGHAVRSAILKVTQPAYLLDINGLPAVGRGGTITIGSDAPLQSAAVPLRAYTPPLHPEDLGDPQFK
ncbi:MAG: 2-nitropropane dioxygenase, partial [Desulfobacteraceae bacterium]|nr:2-nitropropane dioxygenase [Desulfobacteraceae bacterium]